MAGQKVSLVSYRRNSSDMDLSSSDDEPQPVIPTNNVTLSFDKDHVSENDKNGQKLEKDGALSKSPVLPPARDERDLKYHGESKDNKREQLLDKCKKERRKSDSDRRRDDSDSRRSHRGKDRSVSPDNDGKRSHRGKDKSITPERRRRRSRDRSRGRSPTHHRHRSRSSGRSRHSPDRRKRSHSPDRRPYKSRRGSRSPESFRSKRLERKAARIDRLGLELIAEPKPGVRPFVEGLQKDPTSSTGAFVPSYFIPGATNHSRITEQIQKRRLLWGGNKKEPAVEQPTEQPGPSGTGKTWEAATFKGDNDGKMTEKFKRLMGIKGEGSASGATLLSGDSLIEKQEEMFSNMEAQYQVARMATHTHRGIGLGFGTFQVPPR